MRLSVTNGLGAGTPQDLLHMTLASWNPEGPLLEGGPPALLMDQRPLFSILYYWENGEKC